MLFITETQCVENEFPKIEGFFTFFRNRKNRKGGGIAILVDDELKSRATLVESGKDQCEMIAIQLEGYVSPVRLICYYGQQENTTEKDVIDDHIAQMVSCVSDSTTLGGTSVVAGDFNLKTGDSLTPNVNKIISRGGRTLIDMMEEK